MSTIDIWGNPIAPGAAVPGAPYLLKAGDTSSGDYTFTGTLTFNGTVAGTALAGFATTTALALKAPLASPALTGNPTAPTQAALNNSTRLATTAYADAAVAVEKARALAAEAAITAGAMGVLSHARLHRNANFADGVAGVHKFTFDVLDYDTVGEISTLNKFTAVTAGYYDIKVHYSDYSGDLTVIIYVNGVFTYSQIGNFLTVTVHLAAGDYVEAWYGVSGAGVTFAGNAFGLSQDYMTVDRMY